jgi:hypothetical protein
MYTRVWIFKKLPKAAQNWRRVLLTKRSNLENNPLCRMSYREPPGHPVNSGIQTVAVITVFVKWRLPTASLINKRLTLPTYKHNYKRPGYLSNDISNPYAWVTHFEYQSVNSYPDFSSCFLFSQISFLRTSSHRVLVSRDFLHLPQASFSF